MSHDELALIAGKLYVFSTGEYSDYSYNGSYVALENVTHEKFKEAEDKVKYECKRLEETDEWPDPHSMFQSELIRNGWLAVVDINEIHIGSYGELDATLR